MDNPVLKGKFFVIDGVDFSGKGTQTGLLVNYLKDRPVDEKLRLISVLSTREPSNTQYSLEIRDVLQGSLSPFDKAERLAELFVADRRVHLKSLIEPCLSAGVLVVCDRYMYSTLVYQQTQGVDFGKLLEMHKNMRVPDAVFIIDVSGEESLKRKSLNVIDKRPDEMFDKLDFQNELRKNFLALKERLPDHPIYFIDGMRSVNEVFSDIKRIAEDLIKKDYPNV